MLIFRIAGAPSSEWDADQVQSWASKNFGDELADKLKSKGVRVRLAYLFGFVLIILKGRKLINWKESGSDAGGLRKQIMDFLQLEERHEADADDFAIAVLKL